MKCVTCGKPIAGQPGRTWGGEVRKVWCGGGAHYTTQRKAECAPCWRAYLVFHAESVRKQEEKDRAEFAAALRKAQEVR